ncbi:MAG: TA system VapC family ribonuclease toxin [Terracidiphilus sp.]
MFTSTFLFPDANVWLALVHEIHPHHKAVRVWSDSLDSDSIVCFCRFTQLGFLRLLTNQSAMRADVLTQSQAWEAFDTLVADPYNQMMDEPNGIDPLFRRETSSDEISTKQWADGYLAAFAEAGELTLVTLDKALAAKAKGAVLLG